MSKRCDIRIFQDLLADSINDSINGKKTNGVFRDTSKIFFFHIFWQLLILNAHHICMIFDRPWNARATRKYVFDRKHVTQKTRWRISKRIFFFFSPSLEIWCRLTVLIGHSFKNNIANSWLISKHDSTNLTGIFKYMSRRKFL